MSTAFLVSSGPKKCERKRAAESERGAGMVNSLGDEHEMRHDPDCCAQRGSGSCKAGYKQAKTHASTCHSGVSAFTTCCYDVTALGMTDLELSEHLGEPALNPALTCSEAWCTSPGVPEGTKDCFAGSDTEPCTCSRGEAVQLGETTEFI
eukprot:g4790.t1